MPSATQHYSLCLNHPRFSHPHVLGHRVHNEPRRLVLDFAICSSLKICPKGHSFCGGSMDSPGRSSSQDTTGLGATPPQWTQPSLKGGAWPFHQPPFPRRGFKGALPCSTDASPSLLAAHLPVPSLAYHFLCGSPYPTPMP